MKLATLRNGTRDGQLVIVSRDLSTAIDASAIAPNLRSALDDWARIEPELQALASHLASGTAKGGFPFDPVNAMAPLPRSHQFVDASAFLNHGDIMEKAYNLTVKKTPGIPILVPRQGDDFRGPCDDYAFPDERDQCDFEGEFAVITDDIPMGTSAQQAHTHIRLITIINDVSMRAHLLRELQMGFGLIHAKPATIFAPVAVTPDELGPAWRDGRVHLEMKVARNGEWFGHPNGGEMDWGFGDILAHLAYNRRLGAGLVLGSGSVSNRDYRHVGSACLAERRAIEVIDHGHSTTEFIHYGETLRFEVLDAQGLSVFGAINARFVAPDGR